MLKPFCAAALIITLALTSLANACGYGFVGRNGQLFVYVDKELHQLAIETAGPPVMPIVLDSEEDAMEYFEGFMLQTISREVDWSKQDLLIFAWRGPSDDRIQVIENIDGRVDRLFLHHTGTRGETRMHIDVFRVDRGERWMLHSLPVGFDQVAQARC